MQMWSWLQSLPMFSNKVKVDFVSGLHSRNLELPLVLICNHLSYKDVVNLLTVCKAWNEILLKDTDIWRRMFVHRYHREVAFRNMCHLNGWGSKVLVEAETQVLPSNRDIVPILAKYGLTNATHDILGMKKVTEKRFLEESVKVPVGGSICVMRLSDDAIFCALQGGEVKMWMLKDLSTCARTFKGHRRVAYYISNVHNVVSNDCEQEAPSEGDGSNSVGNPQLLKGDAIFATSSIDWTIRLWSIGTGSTLRIFSLDSATYERFGSLAVQQGHVMAVAHLMDKSFQVNLYRIAGGRPPSNTDGDAGRCCFLQPPSGGAEDDRQSRTESHQQLSYPESPQVEDETPNRSLVVGSEDKRQKRGKRWTVRVFTVVGEDRDDPSLPGHCQIQVREIPMEAEGQELVLSVLGVSAFEDTLACCVEVHWPHNALYRYGGKVHQVSWHRTGENDGAPVNLVPFERRELVLYNSCTGQRLWRRPLAGSGSGNALYVMSLNSFAFLALDESGKLLVSTMERFTSSATANHTDNADPGPPLLEPCSGITSCIHWSLASHRNGFAIFKSSRHMSDHYGSQAIFVFNYYKPKAEWHS